MKCLMSKVFGKSIMNEPEKYFSKEVLEKIDEQAKKKIPLRRIRKDMSLFKETEMILVV